MTESDVPDSLVYVMSIPCRRCLVVPGEDCNAPRKQSYQLQVNRQHNVRIQEGMRLRQEDLASTTEQR